MLVPASTLRVLLASGKTVPLGVVGFSNTPWLDDGDEVKVRKGKSPRPGDLALCDIGGWADLRRILLKTAPATYRTALDALPGAFEEVREEQILATVVDHPGAGDRRGRLWARLHPLAGRIAAWIYWGRKIGRAPDPRNDEVSTIRNKYAWQVDNYQTILQVPLGDWTRDLVARHVPAGGTLLVPGSGVGREALHLARLGYRVLGVDLVPDMVDASRKNAAAMGLNAEFQCGDVTTLDLGGRRFDGVFMTALIYSFIPGRERRVQCLRALGRSLAPGGCIIYSAHLVHRLEQFARLVAVAMRRRMRGDRVSEFGDWFTWFVTPEGRLETAYSHRFFTRDLRAEARRAGFGQVESVGNDHFVAGDFRA